MAKIKLQYYFFAAGIGFIASFVPLAYRFATQEPAETQHNGYLISIVRFAISGECMFAFSARSSTQGRRCKLKSPLTASIDI